MKNLKNLNDFINESENNSEKYKGLISIIRYVIEGSTEKEIADELKELIPKISDEGAIKINKFMETHEATIKKFGGFPFPGDEPEFDTTVGADPFYKVISKIISQF